MAPSTRLRTGKRANTSQSSQDQQSTRITLDDLPAEMINDIFGYLRPHDLTQLAQCSMKYRDITQSMLWHSVELHRQDAHHRPNGLSTQQDIDRTYLDETLRAPRSYRAGGFWDFDFEKRNAKFGTAIRQLFRTAGKSKAWTRLAPFVHHMCITVTHKSPISIWNMILSLPNLKSVEIIGECSSNHQTPPFPANLRAPISQKIRSIRLRGYVPANFVQEICTASAATIASLDLGALEPPEAFSDDAEEIQALKSLGESIYVAPRGILWLKPPSSSLLTSLTHLLLCKNGDFDGHTVRYAEVELDVNPAHDKAELREWSTILRAARATLIEVHLEHRPIHFIELLMSDSQFSFNDETQYCPNCTRFDHRFCNEILLGTFDDGQAWPKLERLTLRGLNLVGFESEYGEDLLLFAERALPGVEVQEKKGHYMYFDADKGTIENMTGVDGLKPQLDIPWLR